LRLSIRLNSPEPNAGQMVDLIIYAEMEKNARDRAQSAVERARGRMSAHEATPQIKISTAVVDGSPKQMILNETGSFGADLIVVGSHGHGAVERFLLGSVFQPVALHAMCLVEIVGGPA